MIPARGWGDGSKLTTPIEEFRAQRAAPDALDAMAFLGDGGARTTQLTIGPRGRGNTKR